jgi:hypothetical protein
MFGQERSRAWSQLPEPKPSWETFKRMLPVFDHDPEKTRQAWIKKQQRRTEDRLNELERIEGERTHQTFAWPAR